MKHPLLHRPLTIGTLTIVNRLILPPMATNKSKSDGTVTDELCTYYDTVSRGGHFGLIIQEHSYVSPEGKASPNQVSISCDHDIEGLSRITAAVHANGSPIFAQISHAGSAAKPSVTGMAPLGPSAVLHKGALPAQQEGKVMPKVMTKDDINRLIRCFADAAERARLAGYDGVEIHSAHGYMLSQFYSPITNKRADAFTGSTIEGRTLFQRQIIKAVRERLGSSFPIGIRLGASDYAEGGASIDDLPAATHLFEEAGADMISISGGMCGFNRPGHTEPGYFAELAEAAKKAVTIPVMVAGGIQNGDQAEQVLADGKADCVGIGRAVLKNNDLAARIMAA
ncbi:MAG: NADH:flavin oxidoreductase [Mailhella sp.]|nr:NADH:flavin oxidoreductase [Mailhella sp.]